MAGSPARSGPIAAAIRSRVWNWARDSPFSQEFGYDGVGRRVTQTVQGTTVSHVYDGITVVKQKVNGGVLANYLSGLGIDDVVTRTDTSEMTLLKDALGSTLALVDAVGTMHSAYLYEPYGRSNESGPHTSNAVQFTGRENDGSGLYYYRARYDNPAYGRFISEDPLGARENPNLYLYANDDPVNLTDPSGLSPIDCIRAMYYNRRCTNSGLECKKKLQEKYPDIVELCLATNSNFPSDAYYKECFVKNPECQKALEAGARCSVWPHGGLLKLLGELFR